MRWIVVDVVVVLLALGVFALTALSLWRQVKALGRSVSAAGEQLSALGDTLSGGREEFSDLTPAAQRVHTSATGPGVRSSR